MGRWIAIAGVAGAVLLAGCTTDLSRASLSADLDGDGAADQIMLLQGRGQVVVEVRPADAGKALQRLEFAVDPGLQQAVCALPATLEVRPVACDPMDEELEGCRSGPGAKALWLYGGACDPIQLYWNHDADELWWWRL